MTILLITLLTITLFNATALLFAILNDKHNFKYMIALLHGWKKYTFYTLLVGAFIIPPFSVFIFCWMVVELVINP